MFLRARGEQQPGRRLIGLVACEQHGRVDVVLQEVMPERLAVGVWQVLVLLQR